MRYTMKYDFTTILDRKGKDAIALDALGVNNGRNHIQVERIPGECSRVFCVIL